MTRESLQTYLHQEIPLSRLMGITVTKCDETEIVLSAPLSINHNHLGTAFGGSIATLATLAGYCALWVALNDKNTHVVIRSSKIDYRKPVTQDLTATCQILTSGERDSFLTKLAKHGKARAILEVHILENSQTCVSFRGEFVAISSISR